MNLERLIACTYAALNIGFLSIIPAAIIADWPHFKADMRHEFHALANDVSMTPAPKTAGKPRPAIRPNGAKPG
jgi:hypothetical protein